MRSTIEPLEGNKVKVNVTVEVDEFEKDIDKAFKKLAREARIPGFRPGKAPRRVLEARMGTAIGRAQAIQDSLPEYYVAAVKEHDVDVIAAPEFDITEGEEDGPITFDAVVEVRPVIILAGYKSLEVVIDPIVPNDDEVSAQLDRLRERFATSEVVDRPANEGDTVLIDITGTIDGEEIDGLTADDYSFTIGGPFPVPEVHQELTAAKPGDILEFDAAHPAEDNDATIHFRILVKEISAKVLPELDDAFAEEASEFSTLAELRDDLTRRSSVVKRLQARMQLQEKTMEALAGIVEDEAPEPLVAQETQSRLQDFVMRLQAQGIDVNTYFQITGEDQEAVVAHHREQAVTAVKVDLALRAIAEAEGIEVTDEDLEEEWVRVGERVNEKPAKVAKQFERNGQVEAVRSDLKVRKAFEWLTDNVQISDTDGNRIEPSALEIEDPPSGDDEVDAGSDTETDADDEA